MIAMFWDAPAPPSKLPDEAYMSRGALYYEAKQEAHNLQDAIEAGHCILHDRCPKCGTEGLGTDELNRRWYTCKGCGHSVDNWP